MARVIPTGTFQGVVARQSETKGFIVSESRYCSGSAFPAHTHEGAFFYMVLSGRCIERIEGEECVHQPMSLIFHGPGHTHQTRWTATGKCLHLGFSADRWKAIQESPLALPDMAKFRSAAPCMIARRVYEELRTDDAYSALAIEGLMMEMVAALGRSSRT